MISQLATQFFIRNYDYLWLKTMLNQAANTKTPGSTLITGSSHALNGIKESCWDNAFNCSMHSQDIYYDFQCARRALGTTGKGQFVRCFIVMGYYIAYQDLSLSKVSRETVLPLIIFDKLWSVMKEKGISTYQLREKCGIDSKTVRRLRANDNMETKTLNKLCAVLDCRLEDIAEYIPDKGNS